ncbi:MAG: ArsA family ATPase [Nitrospinae bacterium]|nr:ArsA family ATPase [Nitrospinota bacterium]
MTKHIFFSGKGVVGKTTMACATAIRHALEGKKTLIVSTDPASNLSDVFEQEIWHKITQIKSIENLYAMEIDPDEATREYKEKIIAPYRQIMPKDVIASIDEQLSGPCTTEMASFDRFIDFMEADEYDVIVFDTAPTGHTLRLLDLPFDYAKQVEMMVSADEAKTAKEATENRFRKIIDILKDKNRTTFCIVLYPESTPILESYRAMLE